MTYKNKSFLLITRRDGIPSLYSHFCRLLLVNFTRVLELGSGTGLVGMVASKVGNPICVVLTDGDSDVVSLLHQNLVNPYNDIKAKTAKATLLRWGQPLEEFCKWYQQTFPGQTKFDVILAGDVMYKKELPKLFFDTVNSLLSENGTLWLCHVPRANVTHDVVKTTAYDCGFDIRVFDSSDIRVDDCPLHDRERAIVYQVQYGGDRS